MRHSSIKMWEIRLTQFRELSADFVAGDQDSAVYGCITDVVIRFRYTPDY